MFARSLKHICHTYAQEGSLQNLLNQIETDRLNSISSARKQGQCWTRRQSTKKLAFWKLVGWTTTSSSGSLLNSTIETCLVYGGITIHKEKG